MSRLRLLPVALGATLSLIAGPHWATLASDGDWPHWRGPGRSGIVRETSGWRDGSWGLGDPLWSAACGAGATSPLVVAERLYTLGWKDGRDTLSCLDAKMGKEVWTQSYACPQYGRHATGDQGLYSGPMATPEYDPQTGCLYTLSIDGDLNCWDTRKNGERVWGFNLYERYAVPQRPQSTERGFSLRDYGYTTAPLVHGDWVIVEVGDDEGNLMAFGKLTGERQWTSESKDPAGHTGGPVPMVVEDVPCVAVLTLKHLLVARLDKGKEGRTVAEYEWTTDFANNIASPAVEGSEVLLTSGYNHRAICKVKLTLQGATRVWEQPYHSSVCTPVVYRSHVYWASRGLFCLDFATGELKWSGGAYGDAASCIVTGDGRLIVWANQGDLALVETADRSPAAYTELAQKKGLAQSEVWPHIVLAGGRLYLKDRAGNLNCVAVAGG